MKTLFALALFGMATSAFAADSFELACELERAADFVMPAEVNHSSSTYPGGVAYDVWTGKTGVSDIGVAGCLYAFGTPLSATPDAAINVRLALVQGPCPATSEELDQARSKVLAESRGFIQPHGSLLTSATSISAPKLGLRFTCGRPELFAP